MKEKLPTLTCLTSCRRCLVERRLPRCGRSGKLTRRSSQPFLPPWCGPCRVGWRPQSAWTTRRPKPGISLHWTVWSSSWLPVIIEIVIFLDEQLQGVGLLVALCQPSWWSFWPHRRRYHRNRQAPRLRETKIANNGSNDASADVVRKRVVFKRHMTMQRINGLSFLQNTALCRHTTPPCRAPRSRRAETLNNCDTCAGRTTR